MKMFIVKHNVSKPEILHSCNVNLKKDTIGECFASHVLREKIDTYRVAQLESFGVDCSDWDQEFLSEQEDLQIKKGNQFIHDFSEMSEIELDQYCKENDYLFADILESWGKQMIRVCCVCKKILGETHTLCPACLEKLRKNLKEDK